MLSPGQYQELLLGELRLCNLRVAATNVMPLYGMNHNQRPDTTPSSQRVQQSGNNS